MHWMRPIHRPTISFPSFSRTVDASLHVVCPVAEIAAVISSV